LVSVHNFAYGVLNPGLAYLMSCLGCFLGLQCTQRARALDGAARARWLLLAAVSIGATGIWVMHFIAMLGFTIGGQLIQYNVPYTILSMLIAVVVVAIGLLIVGFGGDGLRPLLLGGTIIGIGVAGMHYMGMWAMRMPDNMHYNVVLVLLSVIIAVVAGTAALWAALRLHGGTLVTLGASLIMGVAVSGMHYTGMAALHVDSAPRGGMLSMGSGVSATSFLLPLILGISILTFLVTAVVTLAPTAEEMREDAALMERIATLSKNLDQAPRRLFNSRLTFIAGAGRGPPGMRRSPPCARWPGSNSISCTARILCSAC
jgi:NO-binding membrane sensor protein with MHYT domain